MNGLPTTIAPLTVGPVQVGTIVSLAELQLVAVACLGVLVLAGLFARWSE